MKSQFDYLYFESPSLPRMPLDIYNVQLRKKATDMFYIIKGIVSVKYTSLFYHKIVHEYIWEKPIKTAHMPHN